MGVILDFLASFLIGCVLFATCLHFINVESRIAKEKVRLRWDVEAGEILKLKSAGITGDLAPLVRSLKIKGGTITVVGSDGSYMLSGKRKQLRAAMLEWLSRECDIEYILIQADRRTIESFRKFSDCANRKFKGKAEISIHYIDRSCACDGIEPLLETYETHHPTLIKTENGTGMWLEGFHPKNSMYAYNVEFVPPSAAKKKLGR
mmetsp:Transcript_29310/g.56957  ORF Transcript_29310/g.56957 Transcript_29310/m.56957 type:complete len:205 (+) Transcript_29310:246-860(+)